jgi:hypothetical protein
VLTSPPADSVYYLVTAVPSGITVNTTDTTVNVTGLGLGRAAYFHVQAVSAVAGRSPLSQRTPYPCYPGRPAPATPQLLGGSIRGDNLTLSWAAPDSGDVVYYVLGVDWQGGPGSPGGQLRSQIPGSAQSHTLLASTLNATFVTAVVYTLQLQAFSCSGISLSGVALCVCEHAREVCVSRERLCANPWQLWRPWSLCV